MKETLRTIVAGAAGAVIATAVIAGQPALAGVVHAKTAAKNSVTSKSIKNGQVKTKDLASDVNASLAKANSALQSIPDNSVTSAKIQDGQVSSADVADNTLVAGDIAAGGVGSSELATNSVGALEIQDNSVANGELANNAVTGANVQDHSMGIADVDFADGFKVVAVPALASGSCANLSMDTNVISLGGYLIVTPSIVATDGLLVEGASYGSPVDIIDFRVCNRSGAAYAGNNETFLWTTLS